jgi:hypothetical protein
MTEASNLWYERVENAIRDLNQVLEEHRRALVEQVALRAELRLALFKAQIAHRPAVAASIEGARPSKLPFRAAAAAALVLGSASYVLRLRRCARLPALVSSGELRRAEGQGCRREQSRMGAAAGRHMASRRRAGKIHARGQGLKPP